MRQAPTAPSRPWRPLAALAALCLGLLAAMAVSGTWTPRLGLDLAGGTSITLRASAPGGGAPTDEQMNQAIAIMESRVNSSGVVEPDIQRSGTDNIVVSVANVDQDEIVRLVGQTAELRFRTVSAVLPGGGPVPTGSPTPAPTDAPTPAVPTAAPGATVAPGAAQPTARPTATSAGRSSLLVQPASATTPRATAPAVPAPTPAPTTAPLPEQQPEQQPQAAGSADPAQLARLAALDCATLRSQADDPRQPLYTCNRDGTERYLLGPALLEGQNLTDASAGIPERQVQWIVQLSFDETGATAFREATTRLAAQPGYPEDAFAIVLDGRVISTPTVREPIPNGQAQIEGDFTQEEAQNLANVLRYGALPLSFTTSEVTTVSPTLGGEQLRAGILAGLIGLVLVVVYSLLFYRALGVVSIFSLAVAALLTWTSVVVLGSTIGFTLILAGVIGVIVSIGITADSFVVFFERIRDEIREGRSTRVAVENGWRRARRTILVADGVTFLAALVLYILAVGRVQNFAFTLGLTTLIDLVVVFMFTKPIVTLLVRRPFFGRGHPMSGLDPQLVGRKPAPAPAGGSGASPAPRPLTGTGRGSRR